MIAETRMNRKMNGQPAGWIGTRTSSLTLLKIFICSNLFSNNRYHRLARAPRPSQNPLLAPYPFAAQTSSNN
jgi:hypothetical protein